MSRSDNTPQGIGGRNSPEPHWARWQLPRGTGRHLRRQWQKGQRQQQREALRRGDEPEPARPRHSVHWNYW